MGPDRARQTRRCAAKPRATGTKEHNRDKGDESIGRRASVVLGQNQCRATFCRSSKLPVRTVGTFAEICIAERGRHETRPPDLPPRGPTHRIRVVSGRPIVRSPESSAAGIRPAWQKSTPGEIQDSRGNAAGRILGGQQHPTCCQRLVVLESDAAAVDRGNLDFVTFAPRPGAVERGDPGRAPEATSQVACSRRGTCDRAASYRTVGVRRNGLCRQLIHRTGKVRKSQSHRLSQEDGGHRQTSSRGLVGVSRPCRA